MTEHDRGAYTPQPDAPLQFDARSPQRRKPMPMTLIGSAAVLVVLLGALALHARHDARSGAEPARPVGAPIAEVKSAALPAAQPKETAAGVDVFGGTAQSALNTAQAPAKPPTFAPPPEAPKPRAQLTVQTAEALPTRAAPLATTNAPAPPAVAKASAPPARPASLYHAPTAAVASAAPSLRPDATAVVDRLAATPVARSAAANTALASSSRSSGPSSAAAVFDGPAVQIGAFSSMTLSAKGWTDVASAMGDEMAGKLKKVEAVEKDGKTFYRTSVVGFPSRSAADAFCRSLTAKGHVCFAKG
jgi:hypothetical protein